MSFIIIIIWSFISTLRLSLNIVATVSVIVSVCVYRMCMNMHDFAVGRLPLRCDQAFIICVCVCVCAPVYLSSCFCRCTQPKGNGNITLFQSLIQVSHHNRVTLPLDLGSDLRGKCMALNCVQQQVSESPQRLHRKAYLTSKTLARFVWSIWVCENDEFWPLWAHNASFVHEIHQNRRFYE